MFSRLWGNLARSRTKTQKAELNHLVSCIKKVKGSGVDLGKLIPLIPNMEGDASHATVQQVYRPSVHVGGLFMPMPVVQSTG